MSLLKIALFLISMCSSMTTGNKKFDGDFARHQDDTALPQHAIHTDDVDNVEPSRNKGNLINVNYCKNNYTIYSNNTNI